MTVQEPTNSVLFPKCRISGLQVVMKGIKVFGKKKKTLKRYIVNSLKRNWERD